MPTTKARDDDRTVVEKGTESSALRREAGGGVLTRRRGVIGAVLVAVVVAVLLAVYIVGEQSDISDARGANTDRATVLNAARTVFIGITTVNGSTSSDTVKRLEGSVTEAFRTSVSQDIAQLQKYNSKAQVSVTGAGVKSLSASRATVLLATSGSVQPSTAKSASPISSSITVSLEKVSGRWLVAAMDLSQ